MPWHIQRPGLLDHPSIFLAMPGYIQEGNGIRMRMERLMGGGEGSVGIYYDCRIICKRRDTVVSFTQEDSRVSYP